MQIFIYRKPTLHVSGVTAPIIRNIRKCTRSLRCRSYYKMQGLTRMNKQSVFVCYLQVVIRGGTLTFYKSLVIK